MREMKDSGVEWIGEIPADWTIVRVSHLFANRKNPNRKGEEKNRLSLSYGRIIRKDINSEEGLLPESFNTYNIVEPGDIIIRPTDLQNDKRSLRTGLSKDHGIITSAYIALKPITSRIDSRFYYYLLHSYDIEKVFYNMGNGVRQGLTFALFAKLPIVKPSLLEQQSIADYLDSKCSQIDFIVEKTQQEIEKLKEYRQSMITEAVTKGLDPDVEMKDSGVEWIGEIPSNWTVKKLKHVSTHIYKGSGITRDQIFEDGEVPCIRYGDIYTKYNHWFEKANVFTKQDHISSPKHISYGDLLFAGTGELVEEIGKSVAYLGHEACLAGGDIVVVSHTQNPRFMGYATDSLYMQQQKSYGKAKLKVVHISASEIGSLLTALPPLDVQKEIADYLDSKCSEIEATIGTKQKIINKLRHYKKSIIYEYVTGKKEVPFNA